MRSSCTRQPWLLAALLCAACNGRLAVLNEPAEENESTATGGTAGTGAGSAASSIGNDGSCDLEQWRRPEGDTPRPFDCGVCGCADGEVVCEERPCLPTRPIVECPDLSRLQPVTMTLESGVVGDKYHAQVLGKGGCGDDDYVFCYTNLADTPGFEGTTEPYFISGMMTHSAEDCDTVAFQTFDVDLTPFADKLLPGTGLVQIGGDLVQLGELSCDDRSLLATREIDQGPSKSYEPLDNACQSDGDCIGMWTNPSCSGWLIPRGPNRNTDSCGRTVVNQQGALELEQRIQSVDATTCQAFFDAGCETTPPEEWNCDINTPPPTRCIDARCVHW